MNLEPSAGETVERPPPGLAAGRWEAPVWTFYALGAVVLVAVVWRVFVLIRGRRTGRFRSPGARP